MNVNTGEITEKPAEEATEDEILITKSEAMLLSTVPMEHKVRELGIMRHIAKFRSNTDKRMRGSSFRDGYDFAMFIHKYQDLPADAQPPAAKEEEAGRILLRPEDV